MKNLFKLPSTKFEPTVRRHYLRRNLLFITLVAIFPAFGFVDSDYEDPEVKRILLKIEIYDQQLQALNRRVALDRDREEQLEP